MTRLEPGGRTYVMGVLNMTPDSFSGDGLFGYPDKAVERCEKMAEEGADLIDVGGESSRPGSFPVSQEEELNRVIPVIRKAVKRIKIPISIDTRKSEVARQALDSGASIVNDISGLTWDEKMISVVGKVKDAKVVLMHMQGVPRTMQANPFYEDTVEDIINRLRELVNGAEEAGIKKENIIVDPGIGFGKTFRHNLEILNRLHRFKSLGKPLLIGVSRKSFIGNILKKETEHRVFGTAAAVAIAVRNGADIVRVHDVGQMKDVVRVMDAVMRSHTEVKANV